jgi:hypothetical protein
VKTISRSKDETMERPLFLRKRASGEVMLRLEIIQPLFLSRELLDGGSLGVSHSSTSGARLRQFLISNNASLSKVARHSPSQNFSRESASALSPESLPASCRSAHQGHRFHHATWLRVYLV